MMINAGATSRRSLRFSCATGVGQMSVFIEQASALGDADQSAYIIEQSDQEESENDRGRFDGFCRKIAEAKLHKRISHRCRQRNDLFRELGDATT